MKKLIVMMAGAALLLATGTAFSLPINDRATDVIPPGLGLQNALSLAASSANGINAITDQSKVANWTLGDGNESHAYMVNPLVVAAPNTSYFGIYSVTTGKKYDLFDSVTKKRRGFNISNDGSLSIGDDYDLDPNFGTTFGFYFGAGQEAAAGNVYTEDSKNGGDINALAYQILSNTTFSNGNIGNLTGGNDWLLAFRSDTTGDFTEGLFVVKDLNPVPEPGTMMLLGAGFLGLAIYSKRRKNL